MIPLEWNRDNVVDFIVSCRKDEGIPMFKVVKSKHKYWGEKNVLAICWGGRDRVDSVLFINVPENDAELIEKSTGDWRVLLKKYGTKEDIFIAESYGIYISSSKLPKIQ